MTRASILVVDDERLMAEFAAAALGTRHDVTVCRTVSESAQRLEAQPFDLALVDLQLPDGSGLDILRKARESAPDSAVVMMTAYGTVETAVEAMKRGAVDYLVKPFDADTLERQVERALELGRLRSENATLRRALDETQEAAQIIGDDPRMRQLLETAATVAPSKASVLVQGESGTGKELVARAIHRLSDRQRGPFIKINCAAIPETLLESELFGHEKGAFTGAYRRTAGRFEQAHRGTLLLDEISEISPGLQAKLLRVLQEREFHRVGGERPIQVDVRIVATTNRDLGQAMAEGGFRRDLFYRLNVVPMRVPPLRERPDDIPLLAQHFLRKHGGELGTRRTRFSRSAIEALQRHTWPGNVRELENVIERAVIMHRGKELVPDHFHLEGAAPALPAGGGITVGMNLHDAETRLILETLRAYRGNRTRASRVLGISVRTMRNKLTEYRRMGMTEQLERAHVTALPGPPARPMEAGVLAGSAA